LNGLYHADASGANVTVYVLDTGILSTHVEFDINRATCAFSAIPNQACIDGNGHGTHVAGTVGGTTYGVAKNVTLVGVKVLSDEGFGTISAILDGFNYVYQTKKENPQNRMIINLSLGGFPSRALDRTIEAITKDGILVIAAAGNSNIDACFGSPARVGVAMTVGSIDRNDRRSSFSNWGPCVNLFGPGSDITSAWYTSNVATNTISGTSMASPFVAGTAALFLSVAPSNQIQPSQIFEKMIAGGVSDQLSNIPSDTVNLLVNTENLFTTIPFSAATIPSTILSVTNYYFNIGSCLILIYVVGGCSIVV
jgi:serine protease